MAETKRSNELLNERENLIAKFKLLEEYSNKAIKSSNELFGINDNDLNDLHKNYPELFFSLNKLQNIKIINILNKGSFGKVISTKI